MGNNTVKDFYKHNILDSKKIKIEIGTLDNLNKINSQFVIINQKENDQPNIKYQLVSIFEDETSLTFNFKNKVILLFMKNILYISGPNYHYIEKINKQIIENIKTYHNKKLNTQEFNKLYEFFNGLNK